MAEIKKERVQIFLWFYWCLRYFTPGGVIIVVSESVSENARVGNVGLNWESVTWLVSGEGTTSKNGHNAGGLTCGKETENNYLRGLF